MTFTGYETSSNELTLGWQIVPAQVMSCFGNRDVYILTSDSTYSQLEPALVRCARTSKTYNRATLTLK